MPNQLSAARDRLSRAGRIQEIIDARARSNTQFYRSLAACGRGALASSVRGWLLPPSKWYWDKDGRFWIARSVRGRIPSESVQRADVMALRSPSGEALVQFCEFTGATTDFVLCGYGPPYRGQDRPTSTLGSDMSQAVIRRLLELCQDRSLTIEPIEEGTQWLDNPRWLISDRFVDLIAKGVLKELRLWTRFYDAATAVGELAIASAPLARERIRLSTAIDNATRHLHSLRPDSVFVADPLIDESVPRLRVAPIPIKQSKQRSRSGK